jgi:Mce-associated membrane protein
LATDKEQPEPAEIEEIKAEPDQGPAQAEDADDVGAGSEAGAEAGHVDDVAPDAEADVDGAEDQPTSAKQRMSEVRLAIIVGLSIVVALSALTGWLGFRTYQADRAEKQRELFLQVGRQCALNLTTIDWQQADADVQRILDCATGTFYVDFQRRAQLFVQIVKEAQSKTVGTITEAGVVSQSGDEGQVLVAVKVDSSIAGVPDPKSRAWRMRFTLQKVGGEVKVANVDFVPSSGP